MTFLGSAAAALWGLVSLWTARANSAWGASRVWNSGTSFESDVSTWQGRANQAYDSATWGSGNLWSTDAHSDPNVWTNRYNTGFTDGAASKTTTGQSAALSGTWPNSTTSYSGSLASLTAPRAGDAHASAVIYVNYSVGTHGQARILVNGGVVATATQTGVSSGSGLIEFAVDWTGTVANGDVVTVQLASDGGTTLSSGTLKLTVGSV